MISLFIISSLEGWPDIMNSAINASSDETVKNIHNCKKKFLQINRDQSKIQINIFFFIFLHLF